MKSSSKIKSLAIFLISISLISGIITYVITGQKDEQKAVKLKPKPNTEYSSTFKETKEENIQKSQRDLAVDDIFDGISSIYLKNLSNPTNMVELRGKDRGFIVASFKSLEKANGSEEELAKEVFNLDSYDYEIDIIERNTKIKFYRNSGYILVQVKDNTHEVYKTNTTELDNFVSILQDAYIEAQMGKILYPVPERIYLNATDENIVYVMNERESEDFVAKFKILSIEHRQDYIGVPAVYPDYDITIKRENYEYRLHLLNEDIMIIDTPIVYLYCKYDKSIWDYVTTKLPVKNNADAGNLKYLLKSEMVTVKDMNGEYDLENGSYYNIEIPRAIIKSDFKMADEIPSDEKLRFNLKFLVDGEIKEVSVYNNYFIYGDKKYFSKNIGENVRSILAMP
ncbi:MAG: hypothetical protein PWQ37_473 [Candidatus Petromonas sp.]|jgi:hypothetical protein|nr:hypothetical protein [Candidatus Petromonas sp.]